MADRRDGGEGQPVVTGSEILAGLRTLGIELGDGIFAHSSLSAFGCVDGGADAVCDALLETVGTEGTVAVPTFTWGPHHDVETVEFDVRNTPCEVGAIPETFRQRPEALRDEHVCHSIAAIGRRGHEVLGDGVRPFAQGSGMYRVYELGFWYLFLGCGFGPCTALHTAEELVQAPYRYYRHFRGSTVIRADGSGVPSRALEFVRYEPFHNDFEAMEAELDQRGLFRSTKVGNARLLCASARAIVDIAVARLKEDPGFLLTAASRQYLAASARPYSCSYTCS